MELGLSGRVAIVAASSQGLGKAVAAALAVEGTNVVLCSRDEAHVRAAAEEIRQQVGAQTRPASAQPSVLLPVRADVSRAEDIHNLVKVTLDQFGRIDILVANAGGPPVAGFAKLDDAQWEAGVQLTLMSVIRMVREVLPAMRKRKWGRVITITSVAAKQPINDLIISSTLRPGIIGLSKVLANRYGADGILFNCVAPGYVLTARQREVSKVRATELGITWKQYLANSAREVPLGRLGKPEELADVIAFLASERASYINGATLSVDGGMVRGLL
jgi:3-oxoacyl-[acyl-carrier protein] reductase